MCVCVCMSVQAYQAGRGSLVCQSDEEIIRGVAVKCVPPHTHELSAHDGYSRVGFLFDPIHYYAYMYIKKKQFNTDSHYTDFSTVSY